LWVKGFLVCGKGEYDKLSNQYGEEEREIVINGKWLMVSGLKSL
jgi:hypothetical protein